MSRPLTAREREIFDAVERLGSYQLAAEELEIARSTVSNTMQRVYAKLGARGRTEARINLRRDAAGIPREVRIGVSHRPAEDRVPRFS